MKGTGVRGVWRIIVLNSLLLLCPIAGAQQPLFGRSQDPAVPAVRGQHMGNGGVAGHFSILRAGNSSNALEVFTAGTGRAGFFSVTNPYSSAAALWGEAPSLALFGKATAPNGFTYGGRFESTSSSGRGVLGWATATTGQTIGVYGRSESNQGIGVYGLDTATTGTTYGIYGVSHSPQGIGVSGVAVSTTGTTYGVRGKVNSPNGFAGYFEGRGYFADNLGIGTNNPAAKFHVVGNTIITGSMNLGGNLSVSGAASFGGTLGVTGQSTLTGNVGIGGAPGSEKLRVAGSATITGATTLNNTLNVTGATTLASTLSVAGNATLSSALSVTGQSTLSGNVGIGGAPGSEKLRVAGSATITGATALNNTLSVAGATTLGNTLSVVGATTLNNTLSVTGGGLILNDTADDTNNLVVGDNATIGGTLTVSGAIAAPFFSAADGTAASAAFRFQNDAGLGMFRPADDTLAFSTAGTERVRITAQGRVGIGTMNPSQMLHVAGNAQIDNTLSVGGPLNVTGATTLASTLSVGGDATLSSALTVVGQSTLTGNVGIGGAPGSEKLRVAGSATITGATALNDTLNVAGAATLGNTLSVAGATTLNNTLSVVGATALNDTLNVAGATTLREALVQPNSDVASLLVRQTSFAAPTADIFVVQSADGNTNFLRVDKDGNLHLSGNLNVGGSLNGAAGGDLNGTYPNPTVVKIQGRPVSSTPPSSGQVLKWDGSQWTPDTDNDTTYSAGAGLQLVGTTFSVATGGIVTGMLADGAVTTVKLADGAVTTAKIADDNVTSAKLSFPLSRSLADTNALLNLTNTGTGGAGLFQINNSASTGVALTATTDGSGAALQVTAPQTGTALEINSGAFKVTGAGIGTYTTVFIHQAAGDSDASPIDHPLINGDPNAILIVTYNATGSGAPILLPQGGYGVQYNSSTGRWEIYLLDSKATIPANATFNVMIVKP